MDREYALDGRRQDELCTPRRDRARGDRGSVLDQRIENELGPLLLAVAGLAESTRVIVVLCERIAKVNSYAILAVRPATPEETKLWMEGTR